jgi:hypothetical protein
MAHATTRGRPAQTAAADQVLSGALLGKKPLVAAGGGRVT